MRQRIVLVALAGVAACEIPTEPPRWEQTWELSGEEVRVSVAELLPEGIGLTRDSSAFVAETPSAGVALSLQSLCTGCDPTLFGTGIPVPKPAFEAVLEATTTLPSEVVAAEVSGGSLDGILEHSLSFDPLNPSADENAPRGYLVLSVISDGNVIAYDSIDGADTRFPPGSTLIPHLPIQAGTVSNEIELSLRIFSPEGDDTQLNADDTLGIALLPSTVELSSATVTVTSISLDPTSRQLDFGGVDSTTVERIQRGAIVFDVDNPFSIEGSLELTFQLPFAPDLRRTLALQEGAFEQRLEFTGDELREILGSDDVTLVTGGSVTAPSGTVTVSPEQELIVASAFQLVVLIGGSDEEE